MNSALNFSACKFAFPLVALVALAVAVPASASTIAWTAPNDVTAVLGSPTNTIGDVFTANQNMTVSDLGIYILPFTSPATTAYTTNEIVGLFTSSGGYLTEANILPGSATQADGYYWAPAAPIQLSAGQSYQLVVYTNGSNPGYGISNTTPTAGWATFDWGLSGSGDVSTFPNTMTLPSMTQTASGFYGANILASPSPVPEPQSLMLLGSGLVGLAGFLRFKLRKS